MRLIDADELIKDRVENDPVRIAVKCAPTAFDKERHPGDMSDFRRPAYSVRHPKDEYDTQNMSIPQQSVAGYPKDEYGDTQNMSTGQQNEAPYIKSEYGTHKPSAAALIRAQGEQIRRVSAEEYLKDKIGSDADE